MREMEHFFVLPIEMSKLQNFAQHDVTLHFQLKIPEDYLYDLLLILADDFPPQSSFHHVVE